MTNRTAEIVSDHSIFPTIEGITVDIMALLTIQHSCVPARCKAEKSCCSYYEICINQNELNNILCHLDSAARYVPQLGSGQEEYCNIFDEEGKNLFSVDKDNQGDCVLSYYGKEKEVLCSLHSFCLESGVDLSTVKPEACILWPLALVESKPMVLTVQDDIFHFECNQLKPAVSHELDQGIEEIISQVYGTNFLVKLKEAINKVDLG